MEKEASWSRYIRARAVVHRTRAMPSRPKYIKDLIKEATGGCAESAFKLCMQFRDGTRGVKKDDAEAHSWLEKAAQLGHATARAICGDIRDDWAQCPENIKALVFKATKQDCGASAWELSHHYEHGTGGVGKSDETGLYWLSKTIGLKHIPAQLADAKDAYRAGLDTSKPTSERTEMLEVAAEIFADVAERGDANGEFWLGVLHHSGHGVEQDEEKSTELFRSAAEKGLPEAQYWYGKAYHRGIDECLQADWVKHEYWVAKSAGGGYALAVKELKEMRKVKTEVLDLIVSITDLTLSSEARVAFVFGSPPEHRAVNEFHHVALCFLHGVCGLEKNIRLAKDMLKVALFRMEKGIDDVRREVTEDDITEVKALLKQLRRCSGCGKYAYWTCKLCRGVRYCSRKCQKWHWKHGDGEPHKMHCPREVTTISESLLGKLSRA